MSSLTQESSNWSVKGGNNLVSTNNWRGEEEKGRRSKEKDKIREKKTIEGDI